MNRLRRVLGLGRIRCFWHKKGFLINCNESTMTLYNKRHLQPCKPFIPSIPFLCFLPLIWNPCFSRAFCIHDECMEGESTSKIDAIPDPYEVAKQGICKETNSVILNKSCEVPGDNGNTSEPCRARYKVTQFDRFL